VPTAHPLLVFPERRAHHLTVHLSLSTLANTETRTYTYSPTSMSSGEDTCPGCKAQALTVVRDEKRQTLLDREVWQRSECGKCGTMAPGHWDLYSRRCEALGVCLLCTAPKVPYRGEGAAGSDATTICTGCRLVWSATNSVEGTGETTCATCGTTAVMAIATINSDKVKAGTVWCCRMCPKCVDIIPLDKLTMRKFNVEPRIEYEV
jgi:hypothetical protein